MRLSLILGPNKMPVDKLILYCQQGLHSGVGLTKKEEIGALDKEWKRKIKALPRGAPKRVEFGRNSRSSTPQVSVRRKRTEN